MSDAPVNCPEMESSCCPVDALQENFQKGDRKWMLLAAVAVVKNFIPEILQTTPSGSTLKQQLKKAQEYGCLKP